MEIHFPYIVNYGKISLKNQLISIAILLYFVLIPFFSTGQEEQTDSIPTYARIKHTSKGFVFSTRDEKFQLQIAGRLQLRYSTPFNDDPVS